MRPSRDFLTLREAAEQYAVSEATLWRLLARRKLTRHKREGDKRTYIAVSQLEEVLRPKPVDE
jgi:predicted DNA-binding transcriptional regulator AlpA